jgi:hypothetical protein
MRVLPAIHSIRFERALLAVGMLVGAAALGGVLGNADHTAITTQADNVTAPNVMVHADHPTVFRTRCSWNAADGSLRICHSRSASLVYGPEAGP